MSESSSDNQFIVLHGDLDLKIVEAQHLPNLSLIDVRQLRRCFTSRDSYTIETRQHKHKVQFCNPYVEVLVSNVTVASTRVIKNTTNPKWNQYFHIPLAHPVNKLTFHVTDDNIFGSEIISTVHIPVSPTISTSSAPPKNHWNYYPKILFILSPFPHYSFPFLPSFLHSLSLTLQIVPTVYNPFQIWVLFVACHFIFVKNNMEDSVSGSVSDNKQKPIILHGDLELKIVEAQNLPNMDIVAQHVRRCFAVCDCNSIETRQPSGESDGPDGSQHRHRNKKVIITSDPYVTVSVPQATVARTRVIKNSANPVWNERFYIPLAHPVDNLKFQVKDNDIFGAELIGTAEIPATRIATGEHISSWFQILGPNKKPPKKNTRIRLELQFTPFEKNPRYKHGIASDPEHKGVIHTYFPLRKGGSLRLYQDAHVRDESPLPKIELDGGKVYRREKCWEDICYAISEAHHLIYIVGWSVYHKVRLVRELTRPRGRDLTLGEMLKYKSEEGVRVLLLIWDDKTSHDKFGIKTVRFE